MKTTIELSEPLLKQAKAVARKESTTLRALIESGLRMALKERRQKKPFVLKDARVRGKGLSPEFAGASWEKIRDAIYEDPGT